MNFFDTVHTGTRHAQVKCFGPRMRDLTLGTTVGPVVRQDGSDARDTAAVSMTEGGFLIVRDQVLVDWVDDAPDGVVVVDKFGRADQPDYPADIRALSADRMRDELAECEVCAQLRG